MTSSNGNIFRVTGPLCGEFTGPGEFPTQRPVTRSFDVFFDLAVLHNVLCFNNHLAKKTPIIWGPFYGFNSKRLFRMNLMHWNTDNISHVGLPILTWPGVTPSLTSHGSVNDITQHFSLNSFLVLSFDTKMSHLKRRWKVLRANQCYGNLSFISINVSSRKTVSLKTFPWIFPHPNFITNVITFDASNGINVRFVHHVL